MAAPLRHVTRNLPPIIREPLVALLGHECYTTLVYNVDLDSPRCLKYALSKVLGVGIIAGGCIVKLPQIIKIVRSHSARGLSLSSYLLDTASLLILIAYNYRLEFPFSTYGENIALLLQNLVITVLIFLYARATGISAYAPILAILFVATVVGAALSLRNDQLVPISLLRSLVALSIPLSLSAKVPQIVANFRNGSTGQLSAFLVLNSLAGCLARTFTTSTETGDSTLWWTFFSAAVLNGIIAAQMAYYWRAPPDLPSGRHKVKVEGPSNVVIGDKQRLQGAGPKSPIVLPPALRPATPPAVRTSGQWVRKAE